MNLTPPAYDAVADVAEAAAAKEGRGDVDPLAVAAGIVAAPGNVQVAWHDQRPVAVFGARELSPGVWRMFCFSTAEFPAVILPLTRYLKRVFIPGLFAVGATRVEGAATDPDICRWMAICGGREEGGLYVIDASQFDKRDTAC